MSRLMEWLEPRVGKLMRCDICKQPIGEYLVDDYGFTHAVCRGCGDQHQDIYGGHQEFVLASGWVIASVYERGARCSTFTRADIAHSKHLSIVETDELRVLDMAEHAAGMDY